MTIRQKTFAIVLLSLALLITVVLFISGAVISREALYNEENQIADKVERALRSLELEVAALDRTTADYASWDDTYEFVEDRNGNYIRSNLIDETFSNNRLSFTVYVNPEGEVVFQRGFCLIEEHEAPVPEGLRERLGPGNPLLSHTNAESRSRGILVLDGAAYLLASRPILTSLHEGPIRGSLLFGRRLYPGYVTMLAEATRLNLSMHELGDPDLPPDARDALPTLEGDTPIANRAMGRDIIVGYGLVRDVFGAPALMVRVEAPRTLYLQSRRSLFVLRSGFVVIGLAAGLLTLILLDRMVLKRLQSLHAFVEGVGQSEDLTHRLDIPGADELSDLSASVNMMLERLDRDRERRESAENEIRHTAAMLSAVVDNARDIIFVKDADLRYTMVNPALCANYAKTREEILGKTDRELLPAETAAEIEAMDRRVLSGETVEQEKTLEFAGRTRDFHSVSAPLRDRDGNVTGLCVIARDVTERHRAAAERASLELQLRQAQKMEAVGQLAGGVAHDLNNLLLPILGYTELILLEMSPGDPRHEELAEVRHAAERARDLTRQLLAFGRKQVLELRPTRLSDVVTTVERMLRRTIRENIQIRVRHPESLPPIMADAGQLQQVLMNLVLNAQDAMPEGGVLAIDTAEAHLDEGYVRMHGGVSPGDYVMLAVRDNGHGMDQSTLDRIFEPFFTTKDRGKGTGLGLATTYGIVKQHGGNIWVYSEPGQGTTFRVYFPRIEDVPVGEEAPRTERPSQTGSETILIVEDNEMVRRLVEQVFRSLGYSVLIANGPDQAEELSAGFDGEIDLLLTDVVMPGANGRELYRRLEKSRPGLKVLFMSGYDEEIISRHSAVDETVHFIQKPFSVSAIAEKVRAVLEAD